jgi:hypothetical protein
VHVAIFSTQHASLVSLPDGARDSSRALCRNHSGNGSRQNLSAHAHMAIGLGSRAKMVTEDRGPRGPRVGHANIGLAEPDRYPPADGIAVSRST